MQPTLKTALADSTSTPSEPELPLITAPQQHNLLQSIALHLVPGALIAAFYAIVTPVLLGLGLPNAFSLSLAALLVLIPIQLTLLYRAARQNGNPGKLDALFQDMQRPLPAWKFAGLVIALIFWSGITMGLLPRWTDVPLQQSLFGWLPAWYPLSADFASFSQPAVQATVLAMLIVTGLAAPIIEELFFRGYLLPRLSHLGIWAAVLNAALFSLYHLWTPWQAVSRTIAVFPIALVVQRTRNVHIGIVVHCLLNVIGTLPFVALLFP